MAISREYKAKILWPLLLEVVRESSPGLRSYSQLADWANKDKNTTGVGFTNRNVWTGLAPIQSFCLEEKLPLFTALIVNERKGELLMPGSGFAWHKIDSWEDECGKVRRFDWAKISNPFEIFDKTDTIETLTEKIASVADSPRKAEVEIRGVGQAIFRKFLLDAYKHQCAMCGLTFEEALEAAHIIPWAKCKKHEQISINNGILLCANHHKLFDRGLVKVDENYKISFQRKPKRQYSESDEQAIFELSEKIRLPDDEKHWPDPKLLKRRK